MRGHELAVLTGESLLATAVEEIGDVRVLLRLGGMELRESIVGEDLRHRHDLLRRERDEDVRQAHLVLGHRHEGEVAGHAAAGEASEIRLHERPGQLPGAVRAKVEEDHRVAIPHWSSRADDVRLEQLVATLGARVARADRVLGALDPWTIGIGDPPVRAFGALPTLVAVHRVVAPVDRRDRARDLGQELEGTARRHVAPVEERVNDDVRDVLAPRQIGKRLDVLEIGVNAAGRHQAHQMERGAAPRGRARGA